MAISLLIASAGQAYRIDEVLVNPALPNTSTPVNFDVKMTTPSAPAFLFSPTTKSINGYDISVNVYLDSGLLTVLDTLNENVPLGLLPSGTYSYTVTLFPSMDIPFGRGQRVVTGSFNVVPEPSSLVLGLLAAMMMCGLLWRR